MGAELNEFVGVTFPIVYLKQIDKLLRPMQTRQDFIRNAVAEKLEALKVKAVA